MKLKRFFAVFAFVMAFCVNANAQFLIKDFNNHFLVSSYETHPADIHSLDNFTSMIIESQAPAIVFFWAAWCGPCKVMMPTFYELAARYQHIAFFRLNVEEVEELSSIYNIQSLPTFLFFKNGCEIARTIGANKDELEKTVSSFY